jgi:hypothetical protein
MADESEARSGHAPKEPAREQAGRESAPPRDPLDDDERLRDRLQGFIPDIVKRAVTAGIGAVTGEESIRKMAGDLPKEVASYLITQAASSKEELYRIIGQVLREWLDKLNLHEEMVKVLTSVSFEIKTEVRLIPNDAGTGVKSDIKRKVSMKRSKDKDAKDAKEECKDEKEEE